MSSFLKNSNLFRRFNQNVSIRGRIFIGFMCIASVVVISSALSIYSLSKIGYSINELEVLNNEVINITEVDRIVLELQSDVSIFTFTGRESVKEHVFKLISRIQGSIKTLDSLSLISEEKSLNARFKIHIQNYLEAFNKAVIEYEIKRDLIENKIKNDLFEINKGNPTKRLLKIESLILRYLNDPNGKLARLTLKEISSLGFESSQKDLILSKTLKYNFLRTTQALRSYLYLVNVVMAGEAAEVSFLSKKIKAVTEEKAETIKNSIHKQNFRLKKIAFFFLLIFIPTVLIFSWVLSSGISQPIASITETLKKITSGETKVEIPGKNRGDEIGVLSKAADTFRKRTNSLQLSNNELSQFAYRTSHDLKAPLVSIIGLTDFILEDIDSGDLVEAKMNIEKIKFSAEKLDSLIKDILRLSQADHLKKDVEEVDLFSLLETIELKLIHLIEEKEIFFDFESAKGKYILTQRIRFEQILENLVSNAIKYSDPKKAEKFIKLKVLSSGRDYKLVVSDNGLGISKQYLPELFSMFKRFHTNVSFGSGLGLYLVKKHLEVMNDTVSVESEIGAGTSFTIEHDLKSKG